jgi:uncharacterized protein (DUF2236 family)
VTAARRPIALPGPLQRRLETTALTLMQPGDAPPADFSQPPGEPALTAPDSVSWRLFKNPVALLVGGIAAVILEFAEPRVRSGVWQHTRFREEPRERLQRTGFAAMMTVYGPRHEAEALIAAVTRRHERIAGTTPDGRPYRADDPELLDWVHATACFGIVEATHAYVRPLARDERDRFYAEGRPAARLYGALGSPQSQAELDALFDAMRGRLERSEIVFEFLRIVRRAPILPRIARPLQGLLIRAAVDITPGWVRDRLGLGPEFGLRRWQRPFIALLARGADRLLLRSSPAVQACRRLGLPDDHLYPAF